MSAGRCLDEHFPVLSDQCLREYRNEPTLTIQFGVYTPLDRMFYFFPPHRPISPYGTTISVISVLSAPIYFICFFDRVPSTLAALRDCHPPVAASADWPSSKTPFDRADLSHPGRLDAISVGLCSRSQHLLCYGRHGHPQRVQARWRGAAAVVVLCIHHPLGQGI